MFTIKSKYKGYGQLEFDEMGHEYGFIAAIHNRTDNDIKVFIDDLGGWYSEPIVIPTDDWIGV